MYPKLNVMAQSLNPNLLEYSWSAEVRLNNGLVISIWHTAWHMTKRSVSEIISISSDYPRHKINNSILLGY